MRSIIILAVFLLIAGNEAFAYKVTTFQPLQPVSRLPVPATTANQLSRRTTHENYPKISQVEGILFHRTYEREDIYNRLNRIEQKMFRRKFSGMPLASRMDNILANVDEGMMYGISSRDIAKLESRVFGRTFPQDDAETRITRLEKEMLGAMQGGNLRQRFQTVKTAAKHYNTYPEIAARNSAFSPNYYNSPRMQRQSFLGKFLDYVAGGFGMGTMTGFTPSMYDPYSQFGGYSQYNPGNGAGMQDYYMGNTGGYYNNKNIGSGAGVRILN